MLIDEGREKGGGYGIVMVCMGNDNHEFKRDEYDSGKISWLDIEVYQISRTLAAH